MSPDTITIDRIRDIAAALETAAQAMANLSRDAEAKIYSPELCAAEAKEILGNLAVSAL
jgi:hypothetical protein